MRKQKIEIIESEIGYTIYKKEGVYFLDIRGPYNAGFDTLEGARESAYYQGFRDTKN